MTNEEKYKTPEERDEAFHRFCKSVNYCRICPFGKVPILRCTFAWLALEAEEEKPLACPFCGGEAESEFVPLLENGYYRVHCKICRSSTRSCRTEYDAIAAWNRRAK